MSLFKNRYRIESIRLPEYDYSRSGHYFITICAKNREHLFGEIKGNKMILSAFGKIVKSHWKQITHYQKNINTDVFIIMPNHIHGIIIIQNIVEAIHELPLRGRFKRRQMTLSKIIGKFKMNSAKQINLLRHLSKMPVWQRNYHEHIIRDQYSLIRIREYIKNNPINWESDRNNLKND